MESKKLLVCLLLACLITLPSCLISEDEEQEENTTDPATLIVSTGKAGTYYVVNPDTGEDMAVVSPDTTKFIEPIKLGHNSERVYFLSPTGAGSGVNCIFGCNAMDGSNLQHTTAGVSLEYMGVTCFDVSPMTREIVYAAYTRVVTPQELNILAMTEDGIGLGELTSHGETLYLPPDDCPVISLKEDMPAWSPDGLRVAYMARVAEPDSLGTQYEVIVTMDRTGENKKVIYVYPGTAHYHDLSWSSDGMFVLVVQGISPSTPLGLYTQFEKDPVVSNLSAALSMGEDVGCMWASPYDMTVVYDLRLATPGELYIASLSTSGDKLGVSAGPTQLTNGAAAGHGYRTPDWAPYEP